MPLPRGTFSPCVCFIRGSMYPLAPLAAQLVKRPPAMTETGSDPWPGKMPWRRKRQPTPVFLTGKFHGWRSLAGHSPWGRKELDMTEPLPSTSCHVSINPKLTPLSPSAFGNHKWFLLYVYESYFCFVNESISIISLFNFLKIYLSLFFRCTGSLSLCIWALSGCCGV